MKAQQVARVAGQTVLQAVTVLRLVAAAEHSLLAVLLHRLLALRSKVARLAVNPMVAALVVAAAVTSVAALARTQTPALLVAVALDTSTQSKYSLRLFMLAPVLLPVIPLIHYVVVQVKVALVVTTQARAVDWLFGTRVQLRGRLVGQSLMMVHTRTTHLRPQGRLQ